MRSARVLYQKSIPDDLICRRLGRAESKYFNKYLLIGQVSGSLALQFLAFQHFIEGQFRTAWSRPYRYSRVPNLKFRHNILQLGLR